MLVQTGLSVETTEQSLSSPVLKLHKTLPTPPNRQARKESARAGGEFAGAIRRFNYEMRARAVRFTRAFCDAAKDISPTALYRSMKTFGQMTGSYAQVPETLRGIWDMGSARFPEDSLQFKTTWEFSRIIATLTYCRHAAITGGGPGVMAATAGGNQEAGGLSAALCLRLDHEEKPNPYSAHRYVFENFGPRKFRMLELSRAVVAYPGGFGTLDELWEVICMVQNGKTDPMPIYLIGTEFWLEQIRATVRVMLRERTISIRDLELFTLVDLHQECIDPQRQWLPVFGDGANSAYPDGTEPRVQVIGRVDWVTGLAGYLNGLDPEYEPSGTELAAAEEALASVMDVEVPNTW